MKSLLCTVAILFIATAAVAQEGAVVVNVGGSINCVTTMGESGFDATSYSLGGTDKKPGPFQAPNPPALADLTITKNFDACSENLIRTFLAGKVFPTVTLIQYQNLGKTDHFAALTITLTNGMINNYQITGAPSVLPTESVAFNYSKVCITSITQKPDGSLGSPVRVCYDVAKNIVS